MSSVVPEGWPPLPEQKKIASILTSVDEVIENTQKQIDKLQDLKKATMNELLTKGIGHTEFKDSELGQDSEELGGVTVN
jgi:type I restriction enzyme S subunit